MWQPILAGLAGTALMTAFMYAMTFLTRHVMQVVRILGTVLTFQTGPQGQLSHTGLAGVVGTVAHYAIGVGFALVYYGLWSAGIGRPDLAWGIVFGLVSAVAAVLFWYLFLRFHPRPPAVLLPPYLLTLAAAHVVFALGVVLVYNWLR